MGARVQVTPLLFVFNLPSRIFNSHIEDNDICCLKKERNNMKEYVSELNPLLYGIFKALSSILGIAGVLQ